MKKPLVTLLLPFLLIICGAFVSDKYFNFDDKASGWTTSYSSYWKIPSEKKIKKKSDKGLERIEENSGVKLEPTFKDILFLEKNKRNFFVATTDVLSNSNSVDSTEIIRVIEGNYKSLGLPYKISSAYTKIDGLEFGKIIINVYGPSGKEDFGTQELYQRNINDSISLSFNLIYNNPESQKELYKILESSKFRIRN